MKGAFKTLFILFVVLSLAVFSGGCGGSSSGDSTSEEVESGGQEAEDGNGTEASDSFLVTGPSYSIEGNIVRITGGGEYTASGTLEDGRIVVDASGQNVVLILNGVTMSSSDGPAILALSGASVSVVTAEGTINVLSDGGSNEAYDATIFSSVPLTMDGTGDLVVVGNYQEGIASDSTLTIQGGNIWIKAADDGLNTGGDMFINGGYLYIEAIGDGVDSNANLSIMGGTLISLGGMEGGDGGIDIDQGFVFTLSGGTVIATGMDIVEPNGSGTQTSMLLSFQSDQSAGTIIRIEGPASTLTYDPARSYRSLFFSSPSLTAGSYSVYSGGTASGTARDGLYEDGSYSEGILQTHSGSTEGTFEVVAGTSNAYNNVGADQSGGSSDQPGGPQRP